MVGSDALIETVAVVRGVFFRRGFAAKLGVAARDLAAVPDRRPVAPVEALAHSEIGVECVVHTELDGASIQEPGLVACGVAGYVRGVSRPVRVNHEGRDPRGYDAEIRIAGGNDVTRIRITNRNDDSVS